MPDAGTQAKSEARAGARGLPHLSGLDGIRGLAALAVVLFHAGVWWLPAGFLGVDVFFVVSGFLITSLLISERERSGNTDLAQFWLRRARRLLPVLALLLIVTTLYALLVLRESISQHLHEALMAALYVTNWDQIVRGVSYFEMFERPSQLRHLWSLAVEEQFYIIWPVVFSVVLRWLQLRWLWCIAAGLGVLSVLWMLILFSPGDEPSRVYFGSDARAFTILIGVAVGLYWKPWRRRWSPPIGYLMDVYALAALVGIGVIMAVGRHWHDWMYPWGLLLTSCAAIVLVAFVVRPGSLVGRALDLAPLRWLGQRSYSIYLWHWPVLLALQWEFGFEPDTVGLLAAGLLTTFILSELSYRLIETPLRRPQFWHPGRYRGRLANPQGAATITAALAVGVLLALIVGFAALPGRSPGQLLFAASANQTPAVMPEQREAPPSRQANPAPVADSAAAAIGSATGAAREREAEPAALTKTTILTSPADERSAAVHAVSALDEPPPAAAAATAPPTPLVPYPPGQYFASYRVAAGDSPFLIMRRFELSEAQLIELNGEEVMSMIHPGDVLTLPCPGDAPCAFLELDYVGRGCVDWETGDAFGQICESGAVLVDLPIRFTAQPGRPLDDLPTWRWNGVERKGLDFVLLLEHLNQGEAEPLRLELRFGLPPLAIGDSVMVGAREQLEAVGIEVDAEVSRQAQTSIAILADQIARRGVRDTVIVHAVGAGFFDSNGFQTLLEAADGVRHLIVLTRQFPPREPLLSYERDTNKMLREEAAKYDWVTLVDWNAITNGREDELSWDGTHLNALGRQLYADVILDAVMSRPPAQFWPSDSAQARND